MENKNIAWKFAIIMCILFFGVFIYFYLLNNRKQPKSLVLSNESGDLKNLNTDWQNVFNDLAITLKKMTN